MYLSLNWLNDLITLSAPLEEVAEKLTVTGNEIESIQRPCEKVKGVRIAKIVEQRRHPTKSGLTVNMLDVGDGNPQMCVTAATNVHEGDVIPWFAPGASTASGMELGYRDFDGFNSAGMMASAQELGVPDLSSVHGILILPLDAPLGADACKWLGLDDTVLELSVTPNRGDMLSVLGAALEIHALFPDSQLHIPAIPKPSYDGDWTLPFDGIKLESEGCRAYRLGMADSVKIAPSPLQVGVRLCMAGMRPINNVVDATNYVMLAIGQPLHAFDAASLPGHDIGVRQAKDGEVMVSLDGKSRSLLSSDMVISSGGVSVGLAGVMGGENSEITDQTKHIFVESANFAAPLISKTSRRLGIPSEASFRYARGVDPLLTGDGLNLVLHLMEKWGAVRAFSKNFYAQRGEIAPVRVPLTMKKMKKITCWADMDESEAILKRLGIHKAEGDAEKALFVAPTRRSDISIEEDLIEEVARVRGYDSIEPTIPVLHKSGTLGPVMTLQRLLRSVAIARGYTEVETLSFISPDNVKLINYPYADQCKVLDNPISADMSVMRPSLLPALLMAVNKAVRGGWRSPIRLFECGRVFIPQDGKITEVERIGGVAFCGAERRALYESLKDDLLQVKSDVEALALSRNVRVTFQQSRNPAGHAGQTAQILCGGQPVGYLMRLKPSIAAELDLEAPLFAFELDLAPLLNTKLEEFSKSNAYPPVYRDVSMLVSKDLPVHKILADIREIGGELLNKVQLFDLYEGKGIPEGYRSLAFSMAYRLSDRTLRDDEVETEHNKLRAELENRGYKLR